MLAVLVACMLALCLVTAFSGTHGIGLWLLLMITHGLIYQYLGSGSEHLPFFCGLVVCLTLLIRKQWAGVPFRSFLLFLLLVILMEISSLTGIGQEASLWTTLMYAKGFFLALVVAGFLKTEKDIKVMTLYCLAGLAIGALSAVYQYKTGLYAINTIYEQRASSLRGDPNDTAMLLVAGVPLAAYWIVRKKNLFIKGAFVLLLFLLLWGMVLTGSRGGFVSLLLTSAFLFFRKPTVKGVVAGVLIGAFALAALPGSYWERMETLVTRKEQHGGQSLKHRQNLQTVGIRVFLDHPVLGVGPGNFGQAFLEKIGGDRFQIQQSIENSSAPVAHNMYLEFIVENGLLGGLALLAVFSYSLHSLWSYDRRSGGADRMGLGFALALSLFGMLFSGLFLSQAKNSVLWFMIGLGVAADGVLRKRTHSLNEEKRKGA